MSERLFHGDETRWEVFVLLEGKAGTHWYLRVFRSASMIYYRLEPTRGTGVPDVHFSGQQAGRVILVCDLYSAYKKTCPPLLGDNPAGLLLGACTPRLS